MAELRAVAWLALVVAGWNVYDGVKHACVSYRHGYNSGRSLLLVPVSLEQLAVV